MRYAAKIIAISSLWTSASGRNNQKSTPPLSRPMNRRSNPRIRPAPARIAPHCRINVRIAGLGVFLEQRAGRHELPALAVATLRHVQHRPRAAQGGGLGALYPLNGRDVGIPLRSAWT